MRKVLFFVLLFSAMAFSLSAQKVVKPAEVRYVYCYQEDAESVDYPSPVVIHFGQVAKDNGCLRPDTPIRGELLGADKKPIVFQSFFDFVNYMGILGWQYSADTDAFRKTLKKDQMLDEGMTLGEIED